MTELFSDIPERAREQAKFIADMAFQQRDLLSAVKMLQNYTQTCFTEEEKEFVEFYFNLRMEQLLNER